jgi:uncharacterized protein
MSRDEVIEKVKRFYSEAFEKTIPRRKGYFGEHVELVVKSARELARERGADEEICEISAWLHDIATLKNEYEEHHIRGAEIAEEFLRGLNYPEEKIQQVKHCILNHRGSKRGNPKTKEAQVLIDADALSHFEDVKLLRIAYYNSPDKMLGKLERSYAKMSEELKKKIKPRFEKLKKELENE